MLSKSQTNAAGSYAEGKETGPASPNCVINGVASMSLFTFSLFPGYMFYAQDSGKWSLSASFICLLINPFIH